MLRIHSSRDYESRQDATYRQVKLVFFLISDLIPELKSGMLRRGQEHLRYGIRLVFSGYIRLSHWFRLLYQQPSCLALTAVVVHYTASLPPTPCANRTCDVASSVSPNTGFGWLTPAWHDGVDAWCDTARRLDVPCPA